MRVYFIISFLYSLIAYAQGYPPIINYLPDDYKGGNQNWDITQSESRFVYVANNNGLLEFNGASWRLNNSPNGSVIRSVEVVDDLVFTGCYMDFGYWVKDETHNLSYHSLTQKLNISLLDDEVFWNVKQFEDWVLFQSLKRIYMYNFKDQSYRYVDAATTRARLFKVNDEAYYQTLEGLFKIDKGQPELISNSQKLRDNVIINIFTDGDELIVITEKEGFYKYANGAITSWEIPGLEQLENISIYSALQRSDRSYVLGTISNGIVQLSGEGELLQTLNQERGLNDNTVLSIYEDADENIWVALDNGVSLVNYNSPFSEYIDRSGKLGIVYAAKEYGDYLYLGTNQGLFYRHRKSNAGFEFIENTDGQVWSLQILENALFCGHNNGTYLVEGTSAKLISSFPGTWNIKPIPGKKDWLLQGNYNGLSLLKKENEEWMFYKIIQGYPISVRFFEFLNSNSILANHEFKGISVLKFNEDFTKVTVQKSYGAWGSGSSIVKYGDAILYENNRGIFKYFPDKDTLIYEQHLSKQFFNASDSLNSILMVDAASDRMWGIGKLNLQQYTKSSFGGESEFFQIPISDRFRKNIGVSGFECVEFLQNEKQLIGVYNGFVVFDSKKKQLKNRTISINGIQKDYFDSPSVSLPINENADLNSDERNLTIAYSVSHYSKFEQVKYQYKLEGLHDTWSDWTNEPIITFTNLPSRQYTFKVRGKVGDELTSNEASYSFGIARPWYFSNLAIIFYCIGLLALFYGVHKIYKSYYKRREKLLKVRSERELRNKELHAQKEIIQIKNEKLKQEVDGKSRELAVSTMSLIRKNEFLSGIRDELKKVETVTQIKKVITTIDKNINDKNDWEFFQKAFNNADSGFLQKVKDLHPNLTPNDLKLCAYLRLNLSSKEIAPLLNISIRSVEVKRYRLRKKMDLRHENSLSDYIINL